MYHGLGRDYVQNKINNEEKAARKNPQFTNKTLTPIDASRPMERIQADLLDIGTYLKINSKDSDKPRYVLSIMDVFSRL